MGQICSFRRFGRIVSRRTCLLWLVLGAPVGAQSTPHFAYHINMPPGAIGRSVAARHTAMRGYVQPVQLQVPAGARVSIVSEGVFQYPAETLRVGLTVGEVYRLKVEDIPRREGSEIYPSIELINRLYPPVGKKSYFPIPIHIAQEDLELAIAGKMVVKIIYVEDPNRAFPKREDAQSQRYFDVLADEDPLHVADELGRPIAILRIGSRVPNSDAADDGFLFGSPPVALTEWVEPIVESHPTMTEPQETRSTGTVSDDGTAPSALADPFADDPQ